MERGTSNESGVVVNGDFRFVRSLYLLNLHIQGHNYYIVLCSPLVALHWHRNGWPWMTFNGQFALKSGPSSASNGLAFWLSEKTIRKFAELRICCQWNKNVAQRLIWWYKRYGVIHWRYPRRKHQTSELYSHSVLTHAVHWSVENK